MSSFVALLMAGGLGCAAAFLLGLAFARSAGRVLALGAVGAILACAFQAAFAANELVDPLRQQFLNAACLANALGWLAGTLLVARLRALEWLRGLDETGAVPPGRAGRHDAASSVAPVSLRIQGLPASLPRTTHRTPATRPVPPSPLNAQEAA